VAARAAPARLIAAMGLREELVRVIADGGVLLPADFDEHTPLISSGLLDSSALLQVVLWVEDRLAPGVDLATVDLGEEWDTVAKLLAFLEQHSGAGPERAR
jgi:hypothetical protein